MNEPGGLDEFRMDTNRAFLVAITEHWTVASTTIT